MIVLQTAKGFDTYQRSDSFGGGYRELRSSRFMKAWGEDVQAVAEAGLTMVRAGAPALTIVFGVGDAQGRFIKIPGAQPDHGRP